jgi:hypothetical protein
MEIEVDGAERVHFDVADPVDLRDAARGEDDLWRSIGHGTGLLADGTRLPQASDLAGGRDGTIPAPTVGTGDMQ